MKLFKKGTYVNDSDGFTARDFLLSVSVGTFFGMVIVGAVLLLSVMVSTIFGNTITLKSETMSMYMDLLKSVSPVVIAITTGLFGESAIAKFSDSRNKKENVNKKQTTTTGDEYRNQV